MKIKKIALLNVLLMAVTLTQNLNATEARSAGMGLDVQPWAVEGQLPYIFVNPAAMGQFSPMIYGESGLAASNSRGGIMLKFGEELSVGVFAGQNVNAEHANVYSGVSGYSGAALTLFNGTYATALPATVTDIFVGPTSTLTNQNVHVLATYNIGAIIIGLGASYARTADNLSDSDTFATSSESLSISDSSFQGILGAVMNFGSFTLDASAAYRSTDVTNSYNYENTAGGVSASADFANDGIGDLIFDVQGILDLGSTNKLHAMVGFDLLNASSKASMETTIAGAASTFSDTYDRTGMQIRAGISDEIQISESVMAFVGLAFNYLEWTWTASSTQTVAGTTTTSSTLTGDPVNVYTTMTLPIFFGMEADLSDKWQVRFGLTANALGTVATNQSASEAASLIDTEDSSDFWNDAAPTFSTGVSFKLNDFRVDWDIAVGLFTSGPNFISGNNPGFATAFAISYNFPGGSETTKKTPIPR
jgi:hypothetical protein